MIVSNFAVLLAERKLNIAKVFKDTGISRTTLSGLYHDTNTGIQYHTLSKLCRYLNVKIDDLLIYEDFELYNIDYIINEFSKEKIYISMVCVFEYENIDYVLLFQIKSKDTIKEIEVYCQEFPSKYLTSEDIKNLGVDAQGGTIFLERIKKSHYLVRKTIYNFLESETREEIDLYLYKNNIDGIDAFKDIDVEIKGIL